jgi:hypothetical protein
MKKAPRKLGLRSETLRTLAHINLARAVGGFDSGGIQCLVDAQTGDKQCQTGIGEDVIATTVCR